MSDRRTEWHTPIANDGFQVYFIRKFEKCPILEPLPERITFFNNDKKRKDVCLYDIIFNPKPGYDQRLHRDDQRRLSIIHENIYQEEKDKQVPVLTSLNYARPCAKRVDPIDTRYFRRPVVQNFYARTGIDMSPDLERQCIKTS